jgi:hypothetical protein
MEELKHKDITAKVIGASFEVHKFLGNGFQEIIYQRALAYEGGQAGLKFRRELHNVFFIKTFVNQLVQGVLTLLSKVKFWWKPRQCQSLMISI